jgi:hypothetical protein
MPMTPITAPTAFQLTLEDFDELGFESELELELELDEVVSVVG